MTAVHMAQCRTMRFELFEVWEDGKGEFPLFVTSDATIAQGHMQEYPTDTVTRRWWVREGATS